MKSLHSIGPTDVTALTWYFPVGGNGQPLGGGASMAHIYEIRRGEPPAIDGTDRATRRRRREWWNPWTEPITAEMIKNPFCGPIKTRARWITAQTWGWGGHCQVCETLAADNGWDVKPQTTIVRDDPWAMMTWEQRINQLDPISGK